MGAVTVVTSIQLYMIKLLRFLPQWFFDWLIDWLIAHHPMSYISATFMTRKFQQTAISVNNHNLILSSFMTYYPICTKGRTIGATSGTGTAYPSGAHEINPHIVLGFVLLNLPLCLSSFYHCIFSLSTGSSFP